MSDSNHNNDNNNLDNQDVNLSSQQNSTSNNDESDRNSSSNLTENTTTFYFQPGQSDNDMINQITEFINSFSNIQQTGSTTSTENISSTPNVIPPEQLAQVMDNINHISSAQNNENNSQDSENVQMMFEIEFIMDPNEIVQEEDAHPHFENCQQINDILGKPVYIKKDDEIIETDCNICMDHFTFRQYKRTLPKCNHTFHKKCIDSWLKKNSSCPVCRQEYLPPQD